MAVSVKCPGCRKTINLRKDGTLRRHSTGVPSYPGASFSDMCEHSGTTPDEVPADEERSGTVGHTSGAGSAAPKEKTRAELVAEVEALLAAEHSEQVLRETLVNTLGIEHRKVAENPNRWQCICGAVAANARGDQEWLCTQWREHLMWETPKEES